MKSALFLGAGASVFVSMPTTKELLDLVRKRVRERASEPQRNPKHQKYVMRVIEDGAYSDIEQLYGGIETIINASTKDNCRPIVGKMVDPAGIKHDQIIRELMDLRLAVRNTLLESFRISTTMLDSIKLVYDKVRTTMRQGRTGGHTTVYRRREEEFLVFTTNYDLVMEEYGRSAGFEIVNGFKPSGYLGRIWDDKWTHDAERSMHLVKLHGSVNWWLDADGNIREIGGIQERDADHDIMIAPTEGGKRYDGKPFYSLMERFGRKMEEIDVLFVVGFSYRDDEIVRIIKNRVNDGMYLISLSPTAAKDMRRVADAVPEYVFTDNLRVSTVGPRIIACDMEFGPDTLNEVLVSLEIAYGIIRDREHSTA